MENTYRIKVEGREAVDFTSQHTQYALAVMEAFGKLSLPYPCDVLIWVDRLLPDYGPYRYRIGDFVDMHGRTYITPSIQSN